MFETAAGPQKINFTRHFLYISRANKQINQMKQLKSFTIRSLLIQIQRMSDILRYTFRCH